MKSWKKHKRKTIKRKCASKV